MTLKLKQVESLEKIAGQIDGLNKEIGGLAKKSQNDAVNKFKLRIINAIIKDANDVLGPKYQPIAGFEAFDADDVPTNSDVATRGNSPSRTAFRWRQAARRKAAWRPSWPTPARLVFRC